MRFLRDLIQARRMKFDQAGVFVLILMVVAWFGFGPSYFEKITGHTADISFYFHFHAFNMVVWLLTVFAQPILIRRGMIKAHKLIGKFSYGLFPVMIISILLLIHSQLNETTLVEGSDFFIPSKDVMIMLTGYIMAIYWKRNVPLHSRLMVVTIIPMIEPALVRLFLNVLPVSIIDYAYPLTILTVDVTILLLVINDLKKGRPKWVFLFLLIIMIFFQVIILSDLTEADWMVSLAMWYAGIGCC